MSDAGPTPTPEEVAAILAAVELVLGHRPPEPPETPVWRWSGRRWQWPGEPGRGSTEVTGAARR